MAVILIICTIPGIKSLISVFSKILQAAATIHLKVLCDVARVLLTA